MKIRSFELERLFAKHEFSAKFLLSSSDCDGFSMDYVLQQASSTEKNYWDSLSLGYTESAGHPALHKAILSYYPGLKSKNIVVASPGELNFILMNVLLEKTDHVISIAPSYQSLHEVVQSIGCALSFWEPNPANWKFEIETLKDLIKDNTKLIIVNFPHNPTGSYWTSEEQAALIEIARQKGIYIFSDEMYHKLLADNTPELAPLACVYEKGISLWGTSKTFGLAGLRIGWMLSQDSQLIQDIIAFKDYLSICSNAPSEILSIIALNHLDAFLVPNIQKIRRNIDLFSKFVEQHQDSLSFIVPKAGSTAFVHLKKASSSLAFTELLIEQASIMTVPAEMFHYDGSYIRIGFGRENFAASLHEFAVFLADNKTV